jgi:CopG family transcriptional regulator/antitoxin EndoAI
MRSTRVVSITLPPPLFEQALALAKLENRTMSELLREALRRYQRSGSLKRCESKCSLPPTGSEFAPKKM